jgi:hypothetical protein
MKTCTKCKLELNIQHFSFRDKKRLLYKSICKKCISLYEKTYRQNNKAKLANKQYKWFLANKEKQIQRVKQYRLNNKEYLSAKAKNDLINPSIKLSRNIRTRIWHALKNKTPLDTQSMELIGCTIEQLKSHLEAQWIINMSWDNYGEWHIDHIKPLSKFDLNNIEERYRAFNYTNLQPLWAKDNLRKSNKENKLTYD